MPSTIRAGFGCTVCAVVGGPLGAFCAIRTDEEQRRERKKSVRFMAVPEAHYFYQKKAECAKRFVGSQIGTNARRALLAQNNGWRIFCRCARANLRTFRYRQGS